MCLGAGLGKGGGQERCLPGQLFGDWTGDKKQGKKAVEEEGNKSGELGRAAWGDWK